MILSPRSLSRLFYTYLNVSLTNIKKKKKKIKVSLCEKERKRNLARILDKKRDNYRFDDNNNNYTVLTTCNGCHE